MANGLIGNVAAGYGKPRFGGGMGELFNRASIPAPKGINVVDPPDQLGDGEAPYLKNIRNYGKRASIVSRPGLTLKDTLAGVHSIFHLQDEVRGLFPFFYGAEGKFYSNANLTSSIISGLSGKPLSSIIARPERSAYPWLFVADDSKMFAVDATGNYRNWGINPMLEAPKILPASKIESQIISDCTTTAQDGNNWNVSVGAGALTVIDRVNTTIQQIVYDAGLGGWATIQPAVFNSGIQVGMRLKVGTGEYGVVSQILPATSNAMIAGILYHNATRATVQVDTQMDGLQPNSLLNVGGEVVRVLEVVDGLDHKPCFVAEFSSTHAVGDSIIGLGAFRIYLNTTHSVGEGLVCKAFRSVIDPSVGTPKGIGVIRLNAARDLSKINSIGSTDEDEITLGFYINDINRLVEGRMIIDVDAGTTSAYAATDGSRNYYFYTFRKDDLQEIADFSTGNTYTGATPGRIQRQLYDKFNSGPNATAVDMQSNTAMSTDQILRDRSFGMIKNKKLAEKLREVSGIGKPFQAGSGKEQWYQLRVKVKDLKRIGEDKSRTLKNVTSVQLSVQVTQTNPSTTVEVAFSSWSLNGGNNLDSYSAAGVLNDAYYYRTTGWNDNTGDESLPSPATWTGILGARQKTSIQINQHPDPQVTHINIYRYGGSLLQWLMIGRVENSASPAIFEDNFADESIAGNKVLRFDRYAPVPTAGLPIKGKAKVVGNRLVRLSGDLLDESLAQGNEILIGGKAYLTYNQPKNGVVQLTMSAGSSEEVEYYMNSPIKLQQSMGRVFGPYGAGSDSLTYFFCGDPVNPGYLYWTNPDDPNSTTDANYIEVSTPSEPLMNGVVYDGRVYLFSSERMWQVTPNGRGGFVAQEVANSKGIVSPWAVAVDKLIYMVSKDGVNVSEGGQPSSLTDNSLYPLFPHDGLVGEDAGELKGISLVDDSRTRLMAYSGRLYLDHLNTAGEGQSLIFDIIGRGWLMDKYEDGGVRVRYGIKGQRVSEYGMICATGTKVGIMNNPLPFDYQMGIQCEWHTPSFSAEERRAEKVWGDYIVNLKTQTAGDELVIEIWENSFESLVQSNTVTLTSGRLRFIEDFVRGINDEPKMAVDMGAKFKLTPSKPFEYYNWEPSLLLRPERTILRATDWDDCGIPGSKLIQGCYIEADTGGKDRQVEVVGDDGVVIHTLTINHNGQQRKPYSFQNLIPTLLVRLEPTTVATDWRLYDVTWIPLKYPEKATTWTTSPNDLGFCGWKHLGEAYVDLQSTSPTTLIITIDNEDFAYLLPSTEGKLKRMYFRPKPVKGKLFAFKLINADGVRVFGSSCFHVGDWGRGLDQPYREVRPFGGENTEGAVI